MINSQVKMGHIINFQVKMYHKVKTVNKHGLKNINSKILKSEKIKTKQFKAIKNMSYYSNNKHENINKFQFYAC